MLAPNHPIRLMSVKSRVVSSFKSAGSLRTAALLIVFGLLATTLYLPSSATSVRKSRDSRTANTGDKWKSARAGVQGVARNSSLSFRKDLELASLMAPLLSAEGIATYDSTCTNLKDSFNLGETVCAKASGVPVSLFPWHVAWVNTAGLIVQSDVASTDDSHQYFFTLPSTPSSVGTWRVNLLRSNGAVRQSASFTVHNTAFSSADVLVQKVVRGGESTIAVGESIAFLVLVTNAGPDTAQNVNLVDSVPPSATLVSFTQQTGPACLPAGSNNCTMASLSYGEQAEFTAVYQIGGSPGTVETSARVTSTTSDPDSNNNNSFAQFEVIAGGGGTPCTLVCPTGIIRAAVGTTGHYVISSAAFNAALVPVATGSCGTITKSITPNPTTNNYTFPIGVNVITFETASGETCTTTLTVTDSLAPTISCPSNITVFESSAGSGSATVNFTVNVTDDSGTPGDPAGLATVSCNPESGSSFGLGTTPVICTATDGTNTSQCTFNVTVDAVSGGGTCALTPPAPIVVDSAANACGATVTYTVGATDCGTVTCDHPSGSFFPGGETLVTCTNTPGGQSTSFTVTVNDVTAPVPNLASLPHLTETCSVTAGVPTTIMTPTGPKVVIEIPTASDNCGGIIGGSFLSNEIDENGEHHDRTFDEPGDHIVTWTYTDSSGNTTTQTQTVTVTGNDTVAPVPDVANLPTVTGECEVTVNPPTATDNCAGTVTATTPDQLSYTAAGTYTIHWTYTDGTGNSSGQNQTVVVTDVHAPTIALEGASSITVECHTSYIDQGVTTTDNCAPENVNVVTTGLPNINVPATYTINYTATDGGGNVASVQRTVIVQDTTKPVITLTGSASVTVECHTGYTDDGATASDTCDTSVPVNVTGTVDVNTPGTYTLTYNAMDDSGNAAVAVQRTVTVVDTTAPTISCPSNITVYLPLNTTAISTVVNYTAPVGSDSCGPATTVQTAGLPGGASFPVGTTTNTFTVTDGAGHSTSCSFTVTVFYNFTGFQSPVSNPPVVNSVNAGRSIPIKFSLSGNKGLDIFAVGSPASQQVECDSSAPLSDLEGTETPGGSTLTYSPDTYHYNWKTESSWAGTCRQLVVTFNDGSTRIALFKFK